MKKFQQDLKRQFNSFGRSTNSKLKNLFLDFPKYSTDFLQQLDTTPLQNPDAFSQLISATKWGPQQFSSGHFADLSFTLLRNDRYMLDLYIWHHQDTNIHDHHFSGAFKIVQGESFHLTYKYTSETQIYPWLEKGKLELLEKCKLQEGDTRTIGFSHRFIHQNIHTTNPCITVCFRTVDHPKILLNSYYNQGMKINLHRMNLRDQKRLDGLIHLANQNAGIDETKALLKSIGDQALYAIMIGQYPFFVRAGEKFQNLIVQELESRDAKTYQWIKRVLSTQAKLTTEINSMIKA
jgi:hypothetical protein